MGCEDIRDLLALYAGGESYDNERIAVEAHVTICAACARELDHYREARANLAKLREGAAPAGTFKTLWSDVRADLFPQKASHRLSWLDASLRYAAVAMVGIAIGVVVHLVERRETAPVAALAPAAARFSSGSLVQPVTLTPFQNSHRLILRAQPRLPAPRVEPDGNYYLPRVESIPAGREKDY
jgi:anti-sigma factor RsiW